MKLREAGEFGLIERIKAWVATSDARLVVGIDDDCAALKANREDRLALLTADTFVEGVHFRLDYFSYFHLGWRVTAANFSDIAAMGGLPEAILVALAMPADQNVEDIEELYRGMRALADEHGVLIAGGDISKSPDRLLISLTVLGAVEASRCLRRSTARPGDAVFVTGEVGGSHAGFKLLSAGTRAWGDAYAEVVNKHLTPQPRIREARFLGEHFQITSMIDISDGVASEINHIARLSRVGATIHEVRLPVASEVTAVAEHFGESATEYALFGGEDFELLFTVPGHEGEDIAERLHHHFDLPCTCIGEILAPEHGITLIRRDSTEVPLAAEGYDHFRA